MWPPRYNHQVDPTRGHSSENLFITDVSADISITFRSSDFVYKQFCSQLLNLCLGFTATHAVSYVNVIVIKPIELLVLVSFACHHASTPSLSTWWSPTALIGKTSFEGGFPLRCFQRLSLPYLATQRCFWRNNWYTRGTSTPVLSY